MGVVDITTGVYYQIGGCRGDTSLTAPLVENSVDNLGDLWKTRNINVEPSKTLYKRFCGVWGGICTLDGERALQAIFEALPKGTKNEQFCVMLFL